MKLTPHQKKTINGLLKQLLNLRDGEKCLRCGKQGILHMSHIYPKGKHRKMEYMPENLKNLCPGCHLFFWHKHPIAAHEWLQTAIPASRLKLLKQKAYSVDKTPFDYQTHKSYLESEIQRLQGK